MSSRGGEGDEGHLLIEEDMGDVLSPEEIDLITSTADTEEIVKNVLECASLEELNEKASLRTIVCTNSKTNPSNNTRKSAIT